MTHVDHAWRHRPKALGGTDPIEFTSGGAFTTYRDCVLSDPTLLNFWPCDDPSGNLTDLVGGADMTVITHTTWPQYGAPGPFTAIPEQTAVVNGGTPGPSVSAGQARFTSILLPGGGTPFTLQGWIERTSAVEGGVIWEDWNGTPGQAVGIQIGGGASALITAYGGATLVSGGGAVNGVPTHIRWDYDGTTMRLLQDFVVVDTDTTAGWTAQSGAIFLNNTGNAGSWFPLIGRASLWSLHDGVAATCAPTGPGGGSNAAEFMVFTAGGDGSTYWGYPTISTYVDGV